MPRRITIPIRPKKKIRKPPLKLKILKAMGELAESDNEITANELMRKTGAKKSITEFHIKNIRPIFGFPRLPFRVEKNQATGKYEYVETPITHISPANNKPLVYHRLLYAVAELAKAGKPITVDVLERNTGISRNTVNTYMCRWRKVFGFPYFPFKIEKDPRTGQTKFVPIRADPWKAAPVSRKPPVSSKPQSMRGKLQLAEEPTRIGSPPLKKMVKEGLQTSQSSTRSQRSKRTTSQSASWVRVAEENPNATVGQLFSLLKQRWPDVHWEKLNPGATEIEEAQRRGREKKK